MERIIGEIFELDGEWYQCVESVNCSKCSLFTTECRSGTKSNLADKIFGQCSRVRRSDNKHAIFKKLEKVGEPYKHYCPSGRIIYFQRYKIFNKSYSHNTGYIMCDFNEDGIVSIEIKQTKGDMEEKKIKLSQDDIDWLKKQIRWAALPGYITHEEDYDRATEEIMNLFIPSDREHSSSEKIEKNLKPFDLETAKAGKPVCTRDGRKARIISCSLRNKNFPIAAIVEDEEENVYQFEANGVCDEHDENLDLMMLPEKKEGWVNVYKGIDGVTFSKHPYTSKDEAIKKSGILFGRIDTIKVSWEEQLWDWISNYTLEI